MPGEQAVEVPQIPSEVYLIFEQAVGCVSPVKGRIHSKRAPKSPLKQIVLDMPCSQKRKALNSSRVYVVSMKG